MDYREKNTQVILEAEKLKRKLLHRERMENSEADLKNPCVGCGNMPLRIVMGVCFKCYGKEKQKEYKYPYKSEYFKNYTKKNREKRNAKSRVQWAVQTGKLKRKPCEICGDMKVHGHHDDYSKPFQVRWLCASHHKQHHADSKFKES